MSLTKDQALKLAQGFRDVGVALGDYRFAHWADLTPSQRQRLDDVEWSLLNHSSDLITEAVRLSLEDVEEDLKAIAAATDRAQAVLKKIGDAKAVLVIAAGVVGVVGSILGAIASGNPAPILESVGALGETIKGLS